MCSNITTRFMRMDRPGGRAEQKAYLLGKVKRTNALAAASCTESRTADAFDPGPSLVVSISTTVLIALCCHTHNPFPKRNIACTYRTVQEESLFIKHCVHAQESGGKTPHLRSSEPECTQGTPALMASSMSAVPKCAHLHQEVVELGVILGQGRDEGGGGGAALHVLLVVQHAHHSLERAPVPLPQQVSYFLARHRVP